MTTRVSFPTDWEDDLRRSRGVVRVVAKAVAEAAGNARAIAAQHRVSGAYEASIDHDDTSLWTTSRVGHILEWGSVRHAPIAALRRGTEAAGLVVTDRGKS